MKSSLVPFWRAFGRHDEWTESNFRSQERHRTLREDRSLGRRDCSRGGRREVEEVRRTVRTVRSLGVRTDLQGRVRKRDGRGSTPTEGP